MALTADTPGPVLSTHISEPVSTTQILEPVAAVYLPYFSPLSQIADGWLDLGYFVESEWFTT